MVDIWRGGNGEGEIMVLNEVWEREIEREKKIEHRKRVEATKDSENIGILKRCY